MCIIPNKNLVVYLNDSKFFASGFSTFFDNQDAAPWSGNKI